MPFYFFAWIACFASASTIIITKLTSKYSIKNSWLFVYLWGVAILCFTLPLSVFYRAGLPNDWTPIILGGILAAGWNVFYIISMYKIDVSVLSPLFNFRLIFAVTLGYLMFQETLTIYQLGLFGIIFIGGMFASLDEKFSLRSFFNPSIGIALLAMLFLALNNAVIKLALVNNDLWTANLWMSVVTVIALTPLIYFFKSDIKSLSIKQVLPVFGIGALQTITNFTANIAYSINLGISSLIMAVPMSLVITFLFSIFAPSLLEKHPIKIYVIRLSAAVIMVWAALQLSS